MYARGATKTIQDAQPTGPPHRLWEIQPHMIGFFILSTATAILHHHAFSEITGQDKSFMSRLWYMREWNGYHIAFYASCTLVVFELVEEFAIEVVGKRWGTELIPVRGKHLDVLEPVDKWCTGFSKGITPIFAYYFTRYAAFCPNVQWDYTKMNLMNVVGGVVAIFVTMELFYYVFHWLLHWPSLYSLIHKAHHRQKAPSRGTVDGFNAHPFEFIYVELDHLWGLYLVTQVMEVHHLAAVLFLFLITCFAALNHCRYGVVITIMGVEIYDSKAHDVHHRIPRSNYGIYTLLWDKVFGTYRPYNAKEGFNPDAQLDPRTGRSLAYEMRHNNKAQ